MSVAEKDLLDSGDAGHRFLRGASLRSVGYATGLLLGAGVTPFVTRHLGSANWGRYVTVTSLLFIAAALTEGGLANLGVREFSTADPSGRQEYMQSLLGLRLALSAIAAIVAVAFVSISGYPKVMVEGTAIACVGLFLTNVQFTLAVVLTVRLRLGWQALTDFLAQVIATALMIGLVLANAPLLPFYATAGIASVVTVTITAWLVRKEIDIRPAFNLRRWRALLSQSVIYAAATALGVVYFQIVMVAISLLGTAVESGNFGLDFRVLGIVNSLPWLLVTGAFPILARAARTDTDRLRDALQRMFDSGLVLGGAFGLALAVGAPFVVTVVGGPGYADAVLPLRILGAGLPATFLVATWAFALLSLERYRDLIVVNGLAVVLAIVLSLVLIPGLGAKGAAIVTTTLEVALATGYAIALARASPELRPQLGSLWRIVAAFAVAAAVGFIVPLPALPVTIVAMTVLLALLYVLDLIPAELVSALVRRAPKVS
jgi:O-antigen/teichoic acid export membrane protein